MADLFRYLVMFKKGGVYADADTTCEQPIRTWLDASEDRFVGAHQGPPRFDVSQWAFAAPAGHPALEIAAALALENLERKSSVPLAPGATPRPENVVPVFRGFRRVLRDDGGSRPGR